MATAAALTRLFIGGKWVEAASGEAAEATSPATGESLGPVPEVGLRHGVRARRRAPPNRRRVRIAP
jgi:acyl-CoA reductase-like NAD-dependent aldehyde dehydrogenase